MEPENRTDPQARARARERRAKQIQRRRLVAVIGLLALIILIVVLVVALSGGDDTSTTSTTESTDTTDATNTTETTDTTQGGSPPTSELTSSLFAAELTGDQSVPAVQTAAAATLDLEYDADKDTLTFVLDVTSMLTNPSVASIYEGAPGTSGAAIVTLFPGPTEIGEYTGVLAEGFIEEGDLIGSLQGQTINDLVALISSGNTYASIGNESHPIDAIRGQIE